MPVEARARVAGAPISGSSTSEIGPSSIGGRRNAYPAVGGSVEGVSHTGLQVRSLQLPAFRDPVATLRSRAGSRPTHSSVPATFPLPGTERSTLPSVTPPVAVASCVIRGLGGVRKPSEAIWGLRQWPTRTGATLCTFRTVDGSSAGCTVAWSQTMPEPIGARPRTRWGTRLGTTASRSAGCCADTQDLVSGRDVRSSALYSCAEAVSSIIRCA